MNKISQNTRIDTYGIDCVLGSGDAEVNRRIPEVVKQVNTWVILPLDLEMRFDMNAKTSKFVLAVSAMLLAGGTLAATDTANLGVTATVENACSIGPGTLAFGSALKQAMTAGGGTAGTTANVDADSGTSVEVICTNGATAAITGDLGLNEGAGTARKMISGSDLLTYELYTSSGRTTVLDSTTGSIAYTGTGSSGSVTIYGRILGSALAAAPAGSYSDTVALVVTYTP